VIALAEGRSRNRNCDEEMNEYLIAIIIKSYTNGLSFRDS